MLCMLRLRHGLVVQHTGGLLLTAYARSDTAQGGVLRQRVQAVCACPLSACSMYRLSAVPRNHEAVQREHRSTTHRQQGHMGLAIGLVHSHVPVRRCCLSPGCVNARKPSSQPCHDNPSSPQQDERQMSDAERASSGTETCSSGITYRQVCMQDGIDCSALYCPAVSICVRVPAAGLGFTRPSRGRTCPGSQLLRP